MPPDEPRISTIKLPDAQRRLLIDKINECASRTVVAVERRGLRVAFNQGSVTLRVRQAESGWIAFDVTPRNLSTNGLGFLHGRFVHPESRCEVELPLLSGGAVTMSGRVLSCRHMKKLVHEVALRFDQPVRLERHVKLNAADLRRARDEYRHAGPGCIRVDLPHPDGSRIRYSVEPLSLGLDGLSLLHGRPVVPEEPAPIRLDTPRGSMPAAGTVTGCEWSPRFGCFEVHIQFGRRIDPQRVASLVETMNQPPAESDPGKALLLGAFGGEGAALDLACAQAGLTPSWPSGSESLVAEATAATGRVTDVVLDLGEQTPEVVRALRSGGYAGRVHAAQAELSPGVEADPLRQLMWQSGVNALLQLPGPGVLFRQVLRQLRGGDDDACFAASPMPWPDIESAQADRIQLLVGSAGKRLRLAIDRGDGRQLRQIFEALAPVDRLGLNDLAKVVRWAGQHLDDAPGDSTSQALAAAAEVASMVDRLHRAA